MIDRDKIVNWCDTFLNSHQIEEYCPNGLQLEGKNEIKKIVVGVSASLEFLNKAIEANADMVIVHHGIIWKGNWNRITGSFAQKIKLCLKNDLNIIGYHLPLDGNLEVGNALALAKKLKLDDIKSFGDFNGIPLGVSGLSTISSELFLSIVKEEINNESLILNYSPEIKNVAIVTGGAQSEFHQAISEGFDTFITGEVSEWVYHLAKEEQKTFIGAGHHATERFGVQLLAKRLQETFSIDTEFIDCHNPI